MVVTSSNKTVDLTLYLRARFISTYIGRIRFISVWYATIPFILIPVLLSEPDGPPAHDGIELLKLEALEPLEASPPPPKNPTGWPLGKMQSACCSILPG